MDISEKSKTRAQHYLSQCYLKGFSNLDNKITPLNIQNKKVLPPSNPKNFGQERDFNRLDFDNVPPNYLEAVLGQEFEGNVATALRNIENTHSFQGEDRNFILNLMALFAVRNPARRAHNNYIYDKGIKTVLSIAAEHVGTKVNGVEVTKEFKKIVDENAFQVNLSRNEQIKIELSNFNAVLPYFFQRKWKLIIAPDDSEFITSDFPVVLLWTDPLIPKRSPGFGLTGTQIHFPLSKKLVLIGDFAGIEDHLNGSREDVALFNSNISAHAQRWIFTSNADFYFLNKLGECTYGLNNYWKYITN